MIPKIVTTYAELLSRAEKYINAEETMRARREAREADRGRTDDKRKDRDRPKEDFRPHKQRSRGEGDESKPRDRSPKRYTPLITSRKNILMEIRDQDYVKWPKKMKMDPKRRDQRKYCRFHRDHGHDTEDCYNLKEEIEALIRRGFLKKYVQGGQKREDERTKKSSERRVENQQPSTSAGIINTILGGPAAGGTTTKARKAYARQVATT